MCIEICRYCQEYPRLGNCGAIAMNLNFAVFEAGEILARVLQTGILKFGIANYAFAWCASFSRLNLLNRVYLASEYIDVFCEILSVAQIEADLDTHITMSNFTLGFKNGTCCSFFSW